MGAGSDRLVRILPATVSPDGDEDERGSDGEPVEACSDQRIRRHKHREDRQLGFHRSAQPVTPTYGGLRDRSRRRMNTLTTATHTGSTRITQSANETATSSAAPRT